MNILKKMSQRTKAVIGAIIFSISGVLNIAQQNKINELEETIATSKDAQAVQLLDENNEKMKIQIDSLIEENQELQGKIEELFPSQRNDNEEDTLITVKGGTEEEILNELRNLVDLIEEPYISKNTGDKYCKIGRYNKDNKLLYGLFNISKRIGTPCKYEYLSNEWKSKNGNYYIWADNKNGDEYGCGSIDIVTMLEGIPSNVYDADSYEDDWILDYNGKTYMWLDNKVGDGLCSGLYDLTDNQEVIPSGTYAKVEYQGYGIFHCFDEEGNIENIIKLDAPEIEETISEETIPEETIPEETVPEETVPEETKPPKETKPSKKNKNLIKIKGGSEDKILEQLIDLFDYVGDPYKMPNGDVYRIVGKYKDNKLLFGIFNVTKLEGTQCKYENIKLDRNIGAKHPAIRYTQFYTLGPSVNIDVGNLGITNIKPETFESNNGYLYFIVDNIYGDNYEDGLLNIDTLTEDLPTNTYSYVGKERQAADGTWYKLVDNKDGDEYVSGLFNMNALQEDITTNTYSYVGKEFQVTDGTWYRPVDNKAGDEYASGLYNMETLQEDIPTGTFTEVKHVGNDIYNCTDENGNVTDIKLPRKSR